MIVVDANLLIYAHVAHFNEHTAARDWLDEQINHQPRVGLPWSSLLAFVRIVSNPKIFERPRTTRQCWIQVEEWLGNSSVWVPTPTRRHREFLARFVERAVTRSSLVPDAHLAALALEHGLTLCTTDGDFARFEGLHWKNPIAA